MALYSCCQSKEQDNESTILINTSILNSEGSTGSYNFSHTKYKEHHQTVPIYKYEYRTGGSAGYEYNYDISGEDEYGNSVSGNIDIQGKYGSGYIEDEDGNEREIDVEWVDYGVLQGTDEDGNSYELEVD